MLQRRLNDTEKDVVRSLANKGKIHKSIVQTRDPLAKGQEIEDILCVTYVYRRDKEEGMSGGFTICQVEMEFRDYESWIGCSRRSYKDKPNKVRGEILAFIRAITNSPI